jgi:hypothetical protein
MDYMATASTQNRQHLVRHGQRLEYFTIAYNSAEGLVSIVAGAFASSVSLIGFGLDSLIEVTSGAALLWRLHHDLNPSRRERVEQTTLILGAGVSLARGAAHFVRISLRADGYEAPEQSILGIIVAARLRGRQAITGKSETAGCCRNRERVHESGFQTGRFLHIPFCHFVGRFASKCFVGLVVD